jgi:hypothetical protein
MRGGGAALVAGAVIVLASGCFGGEGGAGSDVAFAPRQSGDLMLPAQVQGASVAAATADGFVPLFWAGVNLGSTVPGRQPGEVAATRTEYDRWFEGMGDLGARVVRIYTILRPDFYDALAAYNESHADRPLFFIQGVWIPEEEFVATGNAYAPAVTDGFEAEIDDAVAVVHGDAKLPERRGHAGGAFTTDVSQWLLAWSIGVEWDPQAVQSTDRINAGEEPYRGRYVRSSAEATPMESWIASMLDHTASQDAARGWSRPLTFTNWLTLDPLDHGDYEPLPDEDLVSVDATHIAATDAWPGGFFASYHAYPYYPDFLTNTPEYQEYERPGDGVVDPYSGYLNALRAHHGDQAVMVTELGIPSSLGVAHNGPLDRDQGNHSEEEALAMNAQMLRDLEEEGYAGGILFEWIDEWFKFTWNTLELELPGDRRQLWKNDLTNEKFFGLVGAEPGTEPVVVLDGSNEEWEGNGSQVIAESEGPVSEVRAVKDERALYLGLLLDEPESWREQPVTVGIDVRPGENRGLPANPGVYPQADVAVVIGPDDQADLLQAAWWEPTRIRYGLGFGHVDVDAAEMEEGSGVWVRPLQILNRPTTVPATGEKKPSELYELGPFPFGSTDPGSPDFDDRTIVAADGDVIELRLPWALLGFSDPSSLTLYDEQPDGPTRTLEAGRLGIAVLAGGELLETTGYAWDPWQRVTWHERRKEGFSDLADTMRELSAPQE